MFLSYVLLTVLILKNRNWLIYFMCVSAPFYEGFDAIFVKLNIFGIPFTLKPFLFFMFLLIGLCLLEILQKKTPPAKIKLENKIAFACFFCFAILAEVFTFLMKSPSLVGINICLMTTVILFLPYYYSDKKFNVNTALTCLFIGLLLSYIPLLVAIIGKIFCSVPIEYGTYKVYGITYAMLLFLVIYFYLSTQIRWLLAISLVLMFTCFYMILLTRSRASWLAMALCLLIYTCIFANKVLLLKDRTSFNRTMGMLLVLSIAVVCAILTIPTIKDDLCTTKQLINVPPVENNSDPFMAKLHNKYCRFIWKALAHERTIVWRESIDLIIKNPYRGYGLTFSPTKVGTHNSFLGVFLASGLVGFLFFISGLFITFGYLIRRKLDKENKKIAKAFYLSIALALLAWTTHGLLQTNINQYMPWFLVAFLFTVENNPGF